VTAPSPPSPFDPGSRSKLTARDLGRFPSGSLFDAVGRAVCRAGCLPRKELYEAWEVARRVRRRIRGRRILDLACGHGLLAHLLLLLDDTSPEAIALDVQVPASAARVAESLGEAWPRLRGRVAFQRGTIADAHVRASDLVGSVHACGALTDAVLDAAIAEGAPVAVLPCCQNIKTNDLGGLAGWLEPTLAIDVTRAARLRAHGYTVRTERIPAAITEKNRLLVGTR
jgi:SAM-dependent methyltransferase